MLHDRRAYLAVPATAGLLILSFPAPNLWPLAWGALIPLLLLRERLTIRRLFYWGWGAHFLFHVVSLAWISETMIRYGGLSLGATCVGLALMDAYLALYGGIALAGGEWLHRRLGLPAALTYPLVWVSTELARGHVITGFPWNLMAYSQWRFLPVVQIADLTGPYGVSAVLILSSLILADLIRQPTGVVARRQALVAVMLLALTLGYGGVRLTRQPAGEHPSLEFGIVQPNIPQEQKWDPGRTQENIHSYLDATHRLRRDGADWIVWPEAALPFPFERAGRRFLEDGRPVSVAVKEALDGAWLILGSVEPASERGIYNSVYLVDPEGLIRGKYRKNHLVPFGEYTPLRPLLGWIDAMVATGGGDIQPGGEPDRLEVRGAQGPPELVIGAYVCYETAFPELIRRLAGPETGILVNVTNDAWFGRSWGPWQHFSMTAFRAVENRLPVVRAANTGVSGVFDPTGRVLRQSRLMQPEVIRTSVTIGSGWTVYSRFGDVFAWICAITTVLLGLAAIRRSGAAEGDEP